ncbi:DNA/RNA non-specific endonuclease, partial [Streptomyces caeni]
GSTSLTIRSGGAVAGSPSAQINVSNSVLNTAAAAAAGLTTAAVCVATGGCDGTPEDNKNSNCSLGTGVGYQVPGALDDAGRSTGMFACVTKSSIRPSGSGKVSEAARDALSGYREAQTYAKAAGFNAKTSINACHLIADTLGGSGSDVRNLGTCWRGVNTHDRTAGSLGRNNMRVMEDEVKRATEKGQSVAYTVIPQYRTDNSKVPYRFLLTARGYYNSGAAGLSDTMTVYNTYGPSGVNLGDVVN